MQEVLTMKTHGEALTMHEIRALLLGYPSCSQSTLSKAIYQRVQNRSRKAHITSFLTIFVAVALFDFGLDQNLSLYALYLVPSLYATWFLGSAWGYISCFLSGLVWLSDDIIQQQLYRHSFATYWNLTTRAAVLAIIVGLVKLLRTLMENQHEMEGRLVQRELDMAREVHSRLLPSRIPCCSSLEVSYIYEPALVIGGDYYDFVPISPDRIAIVVADVSGKGLPAALLMASLQGLVRSNSGLHQGDLAALMEGLNTSLYELTASNRFATLFFGIIDSTRRTLDYVNAGHNPPFLFRHGSFSNPVVEVLDHSGLPLGAMASSRYQSQQVALGDGDVLVAYTDGVPETQNPAGEEFGESRLREAVTGVASRSATEIQERVQTELREFARQAPAVDDLTLIVAKIRFDHKVV